MDDLRTPRLILMAYSPERIQAAVQNRRQLERLLWARIPDDWPPADYAWFLPFIVMRLNRDPGTGIWDRLIIHAADRTLVGHIGFKGGPNAEGTVDLGYAMAPAYHNRGLVTEAGEALVEWAFRDPTVAAITATCDRDNAASIRVLQKLRFEGRGDRGTDLVWVRARDASGVDT